MLCHFFRVFEILSTTHVINIRVDMSLLTIIDYKVGITPRGAAGGVITERHDAKDALLFYSLVESLK